MEVYFDDTGSIDALAQLLSAIQNQPDIRGVQVLVANGNGFTPSEIDPILQSVTLPLLGGIFPAVLYQGKMFERGSLVVGFPAPLHVAVLSNISTISRAELDATMAELGESIGSLGTFFLWTDGLARQLNLLLSAFYNQFGLTYHVLGGGAGSLNLESQPCIITNAGLLMDAAVLAFVELPSGVAARHGWVKVSGPYHVTQSSGNVIHTLNWRPALQVYRAVLDELSSAELVEDRFYEVAQSFPFGIQRYGVERIVRDPIRIEGESLVCVGDVPEGALVDIMTGTNESLLVAADDALLQAENRLRVHGQAQTVFVFDCVSRRLFLRERFNDELRALHIPGMETLGVLSLGEFACNGRDYPAFLNKTAVVGMFAA